MAGLPAAVAQQRGASRAGVVTALLILYLVWGSTYLAIRFAIETIPPFLMLALRFLSAGVLLYGFLRLRGVPRPTLAEWLSSTVMALLLLVGAMGTVSFAEQWLSSSIVAIIIATMPLWLALFMRFRGERSGGWELFGMALGLIGVLLLNAEQELRANPLVALLLMLAPISWALGSTLSRSLPQPKGAMASAAQMLSGGVLLGIIALLRGETISGTPSLRSLLALIYLATFGSIVAFSAYLYLLERRVRPALATSYAYVNPVIAVLLGVGLADERIGPFGYAGMTIILLGVILVITVATRRQSGRTAYR